MKKLLKHSKIIGSRVLAFFLLGLFLISFYPNELEKKISRHLKKVYKVENYEKVHIDNKDLFLRSNTEIFKLLSDKKELGYFTVTLAAGCQEGGCNIQGQADQFEFFYMLTAFDNQANILKVKILDYESEYGYEIMAPGWLKQFEKNKKAVLEYDKDIDGISGATKSANSVVSEINIISAFMREHILSDSTLHLD